jgi:hypothetical protein
MKKLKVDLSYSFPKIFFSVILSYIIITLPKKFNTNSNKTFVINRTNNLLGFLFRKFNQIKKTFKIHVVF